MSKKAKVEDEGVQPLCEEMQKVQDKIENIEEEFDAKVLKLQSQFNEKKKPLYVERNTIIQKLPNFWFQAFVHHRALDLMLQPEDEDIFKYVSSLMVDEKEDIKTGFRISVTFNENPYFTNKELWKELTFTENNETDITQSGIDWKPGKNPSAQESNAGAGSKRHHTPSSFFTFFETARKDNIYAANIIKDDLWPNPLRYYTGEADDEDDDDKDDFDSELGDEEEDTGSEGGEEGEDDEDGA